MEAATAAAAAKAEAEVAVAAAVVKEKDKKAKEAQKAKVDAEGSTRGITTIAQQAQNTELPHDLDDWELSEGGLPGGSNLSVSKALLEEYSEDEANSKRPRKPTPKNIKRATPSLKHDDNHKTPCAR